MSERTDARWEATREERAARPVARSGRQAPAIARRRPVLAALAAVVAVVATGCGGPASPARAASPAPAADAAVRGVHVVHHAGSAPYLADAAGQAVLLRGVNDNALVQYPSDYAEAPSIGPSDFAEMAALGFDFVRLPVSWSRIMPRPGQLDEGYLRQVAAVVSWAAADGIGVLIDMHQDNYSTVTDPSHESDGAPAWAVLAHGTPCTPQLTTTRCALAAFASFWADEPVAGKPLQDWYLEAAAAVARAGGADSRTSNVVGVELMNEPWPAGPGPFEQVTLYPFYRRMIAGLRSTGVVAPLWFEPSILRDVTDDAVGQAAAFSSDADLVYAVHVYSGVFSTPAGPTASLPAMAASYAHATAEASVFGTPVVVDEYGSNATPEWNGWLAAQLDHQDAALASSAFWLWKQRTGSWYDWATVQLGGALRSGTLRAQLLGRPHVDAVPGALVATAATQESLEATVSGPGGVATLWGGAAVAGSGGDTPGATLRRVAIDGRPVTATCRSVGFRAQAVSVGGCVLSVHVPAGRHVLTATP